MWLVFLIFIIKSNAICENYDYLLLRLEWRPSKYQSHFSSRFVNKAYFSTDFNIKGLYPKFDFSCKGRSDPSGTVPIISDKAIEELSDKECETSSILSKTSGFWDLPSKKTSIKHYFYNQWSRFGMVVKDLKEFNTCKDFILTAVNLFKKIRPLATLSNRQITPKIERTHENAYKAKDFFKAFHKKINLKFMFSGVDNTKNLYSLESIDFCFDKELNLIDCQGEIDFINDYTYNIENCNNEYCEQDVYFDSLEKVQMRNDQNHFKRQDL